MPRGQIVSCLKECMMKDKCCLCYVVSLKNLKCETPSIEFVPVVREFQKVIL